MTKQFTLEYWKAEDWYVGRLKEVPGVFSQGESLEELERNIQEAYELMMEEQDDIHLPVKPKRKQIEVHA
jgi:predicted RNase H-like HicB family nuclease